MYVSSDTLTSASETGLCWYSKFSFLRVVEVEVCQVLEKQMKTVSNFFDTSASVANSRYEIGCQQKEIYMYPR